MAAITMRNLLEAGIHFGHQTRRWNPKMGRYIYGERHGIYIIDLTKTLRQLQKAYAAVREVTSKGGTVLFVGTKKQAREPIQREAERCGNYFITSRWLGGTLTNWQTIQKSIKNLIRIEELERTGKISAYTKKEGVLMRKEREKLDRNLRGIKDMDGLPSILFIIDSHRESIAVSEAARLGIPCVAIVDTNSDPDAVPIPVPGNDDAIRAINLFASIIADAAIEGKMMYEKNRSDEDARLRAAARDSAEATKTEKLSKQQTKYDIADAPAPEAAAVAVAVAETDDVAEAAAGGE